ncbi:PrsW family intramembrane metalloprotease [Alicyclobacillus vulcanalis]|uniref:Protease PrsW n=1 Tax=Alicyclobacillus vulcanalis TaxID=252246 RepID=A0A1N7KKM4_9BACL|nr:PrsW family glutamic-type intramembrane protease [Alicyclobacillus vulcanalis]SIS62054.1 Membrane proteinase PrsW, cleaves anti-sigma factor RsiW, M82 family [Alicyclobacillus vulcanalis]
MYLALAVLPGLLFLALIYTYDKLHPEPKREIAKLFLLGALVVLPAGVIERTLLDHAPTQPTTWRGIFATAFFVAGMVEEFLKAAVFERTVLDRGRLQAPVDAIVYACAIGLGFATVENILYVTSSGFWTAVVRAVTAVPAHFMFAIIMGYQFARARFLGTSRAWGYIAPAIAHGVYDTFALAGSLIADFVLAGVLILLCEYSVHILRRARQPWRIRWT